jgi:hypothetical protein
VTCARSGRFVTVLLVLLVAVVTLVGCSGDAASTSSTTPTADTTGKLEKTKNTEEFATKDWTDATTGGDAVAVPDGSGLIAALDKAEASTWTIRYDVDSISDVDFLTQTWKSPVMDSEMLGTDESGEEQLIRIVYNEKTDEVKTCGTGKDRARCEVEPNDSTRPRLRVFRNLSPVALRMSVGAAAENPAAKFATRTVLGRAASCVTVPPLEEDGITQACVDNRSGVVLYLDGLIDNIVFDLLVVDAEITPAPAVAP